MSVNSLLRLTIENGGGTFDRNLESVAPERGFAVGLITGTYQIVFLDDLETLNQSIFDLQRDFPAAYIGTWVKDGKIHLDPVAIVDRKSVALDLARKRNQEAIYNFETGETINV